MSANEDQIVPALLHQLENVKVSAVETDEDQQQPPKIESALESGSCEKKAMPFLKRKSQRTVIRENLDWSQVGPRVNSRFHHTATSRRLSAPGPRVSALVASCYRQKICGGEIHIPSLMKEAPRGDPARIERKRVVPTAEKVNQRRSAASGRSSAPGRLISSSN